MSTDVCGRCDAPGQDGNYCTVCGYDLRPPDAAVLLPRHRELRETPELVDCVSCGARNAGSRRVCARCRRPLTEDGASVTPPPSQPPLLADFGPALRAAPPQPRSSRLLLLVVGLAAVVLLGVTGTLLAARGVWPFRSEEPPRQAFAELAVAGTRASSARDGEPADRLVDADPRTAWAEGAGGPGVGQWVELRLDAPALLRRLTVWNGDQGTSRFLTRNRVRELRIDSGGERFTVELLDTEGPQAVELPRVVEAGRVRLTILSVHGANPSADTALSEVEVYGTSAG